MCSAPEPHCVHRLVSAQGDSESWGGGGQVGIQCRLGNTLAQQGIRERYQRLQEPWRGQARLGVVTKGSLEKGAVYLGLGGEL